MHFWANFRQICKMLADMWMFLIIKITSRTILDILFVFKSKFSSYLNDVQSRYSFFMLVILTLTERENEFILTDSIKDSYRECLMNLSEETNIHQMGLFSLSDVFL